MAFLLASKGNEKNKGRMTKGGSFLLFPYSSAAMGFPPLLEAFELVEALLWHHLAEVLPHRRGQDDHPLPRDLLLQPSFIDDLHRVLRPFVGEDLDVLAELLGFFGDLIEDFFELAFWIGEALDGVEFGEFVEFEAFLGARDDDLAEAEAVLGEGEAHRLIHFLLLCLDSMGEDDFLDAFHCSPPCCP